MTYVSNLIIPSIISFVLIVGICEKRKVYDIFCDGAKEGIKITLKMFPTLIGIFIAIGMLKGSGLLENISNKIAILTNAINFPKEIIPLAIIKPVSGSASVALASNLIKIYGADSNIGMIAAAIMGSSETTFYVIAIYMNSIGAKKSNKVFIPAILADFASIITAILILR